MAPIKNATAAGPAPTKRMSLPLENGGRVSTAGPVVTMEANRPGSPTPGAANAGPQGAGAAPAGGGADVMSSLPPAVSGNPELMGAVKQLTSNPTFRAQVMNGQAPNAAPMGGPPSPPIAAQPTVQGRPVNADGTITGANGGVQQLGNAARRRAGLPPAEAANPDMTAPVLKPGMALPQGGGGAERSDPAGARFQALQTEEAVPLQEQGVDPAAQVAGFGPGVNNAAAGGNFNLFQSDGVRNRIRSLMSRRPLQPAVAGSPMPGTPPGRGGMGNAGAGSRVPLAR